MFDTDPKYQAGEPLGPGDVPAGRSSSAPTRAATTAFRRGSRAPASGRCSTPSARRGSTCARWQLEVFGLVERPLSLTRDEFGALPRVQGVRRFSLRHPLVAAGERSGKGSPTRELLGRAGIKPEAKFVVLPRLRQRLDDQPAAGRLSGRRRSC